MKGQQKSVQQKPLSGTLDSCAQIIAVHFAVIYSKLEKYNKVSKYLHILIALVGVLDVCNHV